MESDFLSRFLFYSLAVNYAILVVWFLAFVFARSWIRTLHGKWFNVTDGAFDAIHYGGMAFYKIGILLLNVAPLLALCLAGRSS
jgi:hypothetical protein